MRRHWRLTLVEHAHITTNREGGQDELGRGPLGLPAPQHLAKPDREPQHPHTTSNSHAVMPVFMDRDQHAQCKQKCQDRQHVMVPFMSHMAKFAHERRADAPSLCIEFQQIVERVGPAR